MSSLGTAVIDNVIPIREESNGKSKIAEDIGRWSRVFTKDNIHPFDEIKWKFVDACIKNSDGKVIFEQKNVEVPDWWEQNCTNIVASKYFRYVGETKESSVKQVFLRVAKTLRKWADEQGYFNTELDAKIYEEELIWALLHQLGAFNSPVWFNLGIPDRKQAASACFISGVDDTLDSIMEFQKSEAIIFAGGSGSGANLSSLRSSYEKLSSGAYVSGPLAWMRGLDQYAQAMKSGGSCRKAAKMVVLDIDHPDILETKDGRPGFIKSKAVEEKRAHDLILKCGYSRDYDDPNGAYKNVLYQNANHSVSISDEFMQAVLNDDDWTTLDCSDKPVKTYKAKELWKEISEAAWLCADPGVQFSTTLNKWHTVPNSGRIRSTNPCFAAETKIATEFGLIQIADLYERIFDGDVKVAVHLGDRVEMRPAVVFPTGENPLLSVKFKSGRELVVTPNHNFLLSDGTKKPAAELVVGDQVDIQCAEGSFGNFDCGLSDSVEWFKIAGFVVGDGWMTETVRHSRKHTEKGWKSDFQHGEIGMCFGKHDKDILSKISSFLHKQEIPFSLKTQSGSIGESPDYMRIRRIGLFRSIEAIACPAGSRSYNKRIQPGVFESPRLNQLAFLSGLISADGTFRMSAKGHGDNIPTRELRLSSMSLGLLQDVQAILLNMGIKSTIMQDRNSASRSGKFTYTSASGEVCTYDSKRTLHELAVYGHSLRKLRDGMKEIGGLLSDRKQAQLDDFLPDGHSDPIHDVWHDSVASVDDTGRVELTYNMTEFTTHTIIAEGVRIPQCSEFAHIDNTACNLCALNLTKFFDGGVFNFEKFKQAVRVFVISQNSIIEKADYPTDLITKNSHKLRPIGLNYGDLGSLIMSQGYSYDSNEGRVIAARMASLMTGLAYQVSAQLAARIGTFADFEKNCEDMLSIMEKHQRADDDILRRWSLSSDPLGDDIVSKSAEVWEETIRLGKKYGYSISQASLQAPLGTVSFLMGMNTTGIEPAFSLVSYKTLVGGGVLKLVNQATKDGLRALGYTDEETAVISKYIEDNDCIEGAPEFKNEHLHVFDCAMPSGDSSRCLDPMAHITMMAAIQPLITCAQSKTVNLPNSATPQDISDIYMESWKLGLKCVSVYRDGSKLSQPLATKERVGEQNGAIVFSDSGPSPIQQRRRLPEDISGHRHRFEIDGYKGYIQMNEYPDGKLGEVFLKLGKPGSTISGLIDGYTQLLSIALQYGVPLEKLIRSFVDTRFEPAGMTRNPKIRFAKSLYDYLMKYLDIRYYSGEVTGIAYRLEEPDSQPAASISKNSESIAPITQIEQNNKRDFSGPPCTTCGSLTVRNGSCYLCKSCGSTSGCS